MFMSVHSAVPLLWVAGLLGKVVRFPIRATGLESVPLRAPGSALM